MSGGAGKVAVLDFGGQYTQLIARRVREMSVYSEIFSCTHPLAEILAGGFQGIILSGGPSSVYEDGAPLPPKELFDAGIPVLGICYGMQAMGYLLGGHVIPAERREYGKAEITLQGSSPLFRGVEPEETGRVTVWMSHGDTVLQPPQGFVPLARTPNCPVAAMADEERQLYAVQFHPEVLHTPQGRTILDNFLAACSVSRTWSMAGFIDTTVETIRALGRRRLVCRRRPGPSRHRRPAHVRLRRQRAPAKGRGRGGRPHLPRRIQDEPDPCGRIRAFPRCDPRSDGPRDQAQAHRGRVHRGLRGRGQKARRHSVARPGHALSRRY